MKEEGQICPYTQSKNSGKIGQFKIFAEFSESLYLVEEWIIGCSFIEQQQQQQKNPSAQGQRSLLSNPI